VQKIFVWIVLGVLIGNVFIAISQDAGASEITNVAKDNSVSIDNHVLSEVNAPINRRLTLFEEDSVSPVIVCGDDDVLHMAWIDSRAIDFNSSQIFTSILYKQSHDFGNTWTPDTILSTRITDAMSIDLAVDGNYLALAWEEGNDVFTMFSYDNGNSWAEPYPIYSIESPSIALKGNDIFLVFKDNSQAGVPYLSGKKLTIDPELPTPVPYNFNPSGNIQICSIADVTTDDDSVYVAIKDQTNTQLHFYKSQDNGTTWSGSIIGDSFGDDVLGSVKIANKEDNVNIIWSDNRDGDYDLYMKSSNNYGETWTSTVKLTESIGKSTNIDVAVNSKSEINLCWEEISGTSHKIYYGNFDTNCNELSLSSITDGTSTSSKPTMALDSNNYYYMLWQDDRDVDEEIFFSTNLGEFDKQMDSIMSYIQLLPDDFFTKVQHKITLLSKFEAVRTQLDEGAYDGALNKLNNDILKKMDGYRNENPKDDWILDYAVQEELSNLFSCLTTAIELKLDSTEPIGGSEWCDVGTNMDTLVQPGGGLRRHPYEWSGIYTSGSRTYRLGDKYCNFWLDVENQNWAKNIDYRITFVFYASANIEVKQLSGASWTNYESLGVLPGNSNWRTYSLETNYLWNYDASTANSNFNILFEFESTILLDSISVIPVEYNCDVGESNDNSLVSHEPGVCLYPNTEWQSHSDYYSESCKVGYFTSSGNGPNIMANLPNSKQEFRLTIRYHLLIDTSVLGDIYLQQYKGTWPYQDVGKLMSGEGWKTSIFIIEKSNYYDFISGGNMNLLFQFGFSPAKYTTIGELILIDSLSITVARDYCDFGTTGDDIATAHEPGVSRYPNNEWGPIIWISGKSCRLGNAWSNFYLNDIDTSKDYVIRITYKSNPGSNGYVRQWDGSSYHKLGEYTADGLWHTSTYIAKAFWCFDYNGANPTYAMNALFEFSKSIYVDEISIGVMEKYAILLSGAASGDWYPAFTNDLQDTYDKLISYKWASENVYSYLWASAGSSWIDGSCNDNNVKYAFSEVGNKITPDDFFFFMVISHGFRDSIGSGFSLGPASPIKYIYYKGDSSTSNLMSADYGGKIGSKPFRSVWLLHSCYSGTDPFSALEGVSGRIVISCSEDNERTKTCGFADQHWGFFRAYEVWLVWATWHDGFALSMGSPVNPQSVSFAYEKGEYAATHNGWRGEGNKYNPKIRYYNCDPDKVYW